MNIRDQIIGKKISCVIATCSEPQQSGKTIFYIVGVEFADPNHSDLDGLAFTVGAFQTFEVGKTYEIEFKKGSKEDSVVGYRKKSTDEEKAERKAKEDAEREARREKARKEKEDAEREARREKARKEKEDYEALMAKEGGPVAHTNAADSTPSANLIVPPSEKHISLAKQYGFEPDDIKVMEQTGILPKDTPIPVASLFFRTAQMQGLNPLLKQMYLVAYGYGEKRTFTQITAIDSMRSKALATREYVGKPKILFDGLSASEWMRTYNNQRKYTVVEVKKPTDKYPTKEYHLESGEFPQAATCTVMRLVNGRECPFEVEIIWDEYYPGVGGKGQMWRERPFGQFGKCAEAIALRVAFADALSRMYVAEEFERAAAVAEVQDVAMEVIDMHKIRKDLQGLHSVAELQKYRDDHPEFANNGDIQEALANRHREITIEIE